VWKTRQKTIKKDDFSLKYIDPTYMIRAIPANASDNVYCTVLAQAAVHGAMSGHTGFTVGPVNGRHAWLPITQVPPRVAASAPRVASHLVASSSVGRRCGAVLHHRLLLGLPRHCGQPVPPRRGAAARRAYLCKSLVGTPEAGNTMASTSSWPEQRCLAQWKLTVHPHGFS
jgi:hypothetical protein